MKRARNQSTRGSQTSRIEKRCFVFTRTLHRKICCLFLLESKQGSSENWLFLPVRNDSIKKNRKKYWKYTGSWFIIEGTGYKIDVKRIIQR
jgi:hypothetical protein